MEYVWQEYLDSKKYHCTCGKTLIGANPCRSECAPRTIFEFGLLEGGDLHYRLWQMMVAVGGVWKEDYEVESGWLWRSSDVGYLSPADAVISAYVLKFDPRE